jgi:two-component system, response regulator / RNA-binding antiterminator
LIDHTYRQAFPPSRANPTFERSITFSAMLHCKVSFCIATWAVDTSLSVLIIDENRDRAGLIETSLRDAGHTRVTVVEEVRGLLKRIEDLAPDVIVIDLGNADRDLLEHMFLISRTVRRPIAMFVDKSDEQAMYQAVEAGVSAYVVDGLKKDRVKSVLDLAVIRFRAFEYGRRRCLRASAPNRDEPKEDDCGDRARGHRLI